MRVRLMIEGYFDEESGSIKWEVQVPNRVAVENLLELQSESGFWMVDLENGKVQWRKGNPSKQGDVEGEGSQTVVWQAQYENQSE